MLRNLQKMLVPGLVIQAVLVGGGYATGREIVEERGAAGFVGGSGGLRDVAELVVGGDARVGGRHALRDVLLDEGFEVKAQLLAPRRPEYCTHQGR